MDRVDSKYAAGSAFWTSQECQLIWDLLYMCHIRQELGAGAGEEGQESSAEDREEARTNDVRSTPEPLHP